MTRWPFILLGLTGVGAVSYFVYRKVTAKPAVITPPPTPPAVPPTPPAPPAVPPAPPPPPPPPAVKTLTFSAAKFPGAGGPNVIEIVTDLGSAGTVMAGAIDEWKTFSVSIPANATWVEILNRRDGSALRIRKYPTVDGKELRTITAKYGYYDERADHWVTDGLRFSLTASEEISTIRPGYY